MSFSHLSDNNSPNMVDVSGKAATPREARARAVLSLPPQIAECFIDGDIRGPKGSVFDTARLAGIMAAKRTSELIPLCHPIGLEDCRVELRLEGSDVVIETTTVVTHKTGVEMEALTAASVAALTVYDMCKGISHEMVLTELRLVEKTGGKRDVREGANKKRGDGDFTAHVE